MANDALRYTVEDIRNIASALTHNTEHRIKIMAAMLSNPSIVVTPPQQRRY